MTLAWLTVVFSEYVISFLGLNYIYGISLFFMHGVQVVLQSLG